MVVEREFDRWSGRKGETTERAERGGGKKETKWNRKREKKRKTGTRRRLSARYFSGRVYFIVNDAVAVTNLCI